MNDEFWLAMEEREPMTQRPFDQVNARYLTETAKNPRRRGPVPANLPGPGKGVSGETTN